MLDFSNHNLRKAWSRVYASKAPKKRAYSKGIDEISLEDFKQRDAFFLDELHRQLMSGSFKFSGLKFYEIKREGKTPRQIQAPTIRDRIVQKIVNDKALGGLKDEFLRNGVVGSVKGSSIRAVIKRVIGFQKEGYLFVLKTDIRDYFPSIKLSTLRRILPKYIGDAELKKFIRMYLLQSSMRGIPQGPPLSPLMANIYLLALDKQFSRRKGIRHIRYVDDILIFFKTPDEAREECTVLEAKLLQKGLKIHPLEAKTKTVIGRLDDGKIDVLGILFDKGQLTIKPKKVKQFMSDVVSPLLRKNCLNMFNGQTTSERLSSLIKSLNYQIEGWASYYSFCNTDEIFKKVDSGISANFRRLLGRLHLSYSASELYSSQLKKMSDVKCKLRDLELTIEEY